MLRGTKMRVVILLALIGAAFALPQPDSPQRIVGGSQTTVAEYPFIANLQRSFGTFWIQSCAGTLITSRTVLSAAHCFDGDVPSLWRVWVGTSWRNSGTGGARFNAISLILHESYNLPATRQHDVAILVMDLRVSFSDVIQPARIAGRNYPLPDGTPVTAIGWGDISYMDMASEQLRSVEISIINQEICAERYAYLRTLSHFRMFPEVTDDMICAGTLGFGGRNVCHGDNGGPLVHDNNVVVGVVSWWFGCADAFYPSVSARVSVLSDWIAEHGTV